MCFYNSYQICILGWHRISTISLAINRFQIGIWNLAMVFRPITSNRIQFVCLAPENSPVSPFCFAFTMKIRIIFVVELFRFDQWRQRTKNCPFVRLNVFFFFQKTFGRTHMQITEIFSENSLSVAASIESPIGLIRALSLPHTHSLNQSGLRMFLW